MNHVPEGLARWLEQQRRSARASAVVFSVLALGSGTAMFLLASLLIYSVLSLAGGIFVQSAPWLGLVAVGLTAGGFALGLRGRPEDRELTLDPLGLWILKDIGSVGPRLLREGCRQVRRCGLLGELQVAACARALAYLAAQNAAVTREELSRQCPQLPWERLREQLGLLDGVLFLGKEASRVTLMEPFRLRLRWLLGQEPSAAKEAPARPQPEPPPPAVPVNEPEQLSPYELLGLSPSASALEIKSAYRKRVKECHPDLFAGMDPQAKVLAERWTKALNAAYATLNPRQRGARPSSSRP